MKLTIVLLTAAVAVSASHHHHAHQHLHNAKRADASPVENVVTVPGPTEVVYVLNGKPITLEEVEKGIANGSLVMANGEVFSALPSSTSVAPTTSSTSTSTPKPTPTSTSTSVVPATTSTTSSSSSSVAPPPKPSPVTPSLNAAPPSSDSGSESSSGVNTPFPDGQVSCSSFPSQYGAIPVDWMGLGGWTGVQSPGAGGLLSGFSNIMTLTSSQCESGVCCTEGSYCSYACPPGFQKSQWPTTQGSTGQSVGGLLCQGGKLHLTNPGLSKNICMPGTDAVTVLVKNTLSQNVAVCRTDYPGTESETVPLNSEPGSTTPLTVPDSSAYYTWEGASTSAQYYVNPAGVSVSDACTWGSSANPWGNFAPLNIGVGYSNGAAWLSIFQNSPTTNAKLPFTVEIQGDGMSGTCRYSNGQYCGGANYDDCSTTTGCTVSKPTNRTSQQFTDISKRYRSAREPPLTSSLMLKCTS